MAILNTLRPTAFNVVANRQGPDPRPTAHWRLGADGKLACRWRLDSRPNDVGLDPH